MPVVCGMGARKMRECGTTGWRWSSHTVWLKQTPANQRKTQEATTVKYLTVTAESTSLSHYSREHHLHLLRHAPKDTFTCIQGEWCLQDNCGAAAAVSPSPGIISQYSKISLKDHYSQLNLVTRSQEALPQRAGISKAMHFPSLPMG